MLGMEIQKVISCSCLHLLQTKTIVSQSVHNQYVMISVILFHNLCVMISEDTRPNVTEGFPTAMNDVCYDSSTSFE
jgi:hypothetical protein